MVIFKADICDIKTENETNHNYCQNNYDNNTTILKILYK